MKKLYLLALLLAFSCNNRKLNQVRTLNLSGLGLTEVPVKLLDKNLQLIDLGATAILSNSAFVIPEGANYIKVLPEEICYLPNLKTLILSGNDIRDLPSGLRQLEKLENLDLSFNRNFHINSELEKLLQLKNLKYLNLFGVKQAEDNDTLITSVFKNRVKVLIKAEDFN